MAAEADNQSILTCDDMKKLVIATLTLLCVLPLSGQQKLSLFGIAHNWDRDKEYSFSGVDRGHAFDEMVVSFADAFNANPMLHALLAQFTGDAENIDIPVDKFTLDEKNNYVRISLKSDDIAETEARFWPLSGDTGWFVIKMINHDEDTLPRIYFLSVDLARGVMTPAREPDGMNYGFADNFLLPRTGNTIEVFSKYFPSDHIVLEDGVFVYQHSAPNSVGCYVNDPDPSGITNIRATPGGKIIIRLGETVASPVSAKGQDEEDEEWPDDGGSDTFSIYNPRNGWWQIHAKQINGIPVENEAWIHYSVLEMRTRNYGGEPLNLYQEPSDNAPVAAVIKTEEAAVRPMDMTPDGEWMKVKAKAGTGWIETGWLCGNPYTTCP